jgi:hypothetical protein
MAPPRKTRIPPSLDIPVLTDVVDESAPEEVPEALAGRPIITIPQDQLSEMLTERIASLTDRLLRDASAEIHATLVNKVWEKLKDEIPAIVEEALKDNGKE